MVSGKKTRRETSFSICFYLIINLGEKVDPESRKIRGKLRNSDISVGKNERGRRLMETVPFNGLNGSGSSLPRSFVFLSKVQSHKSLSSSVGRGRENLFVESVDHIG